MNKVKCKVASSHNGVVFSNGKIFTAKNNEVFELSEEQAQKYFKRGVVEIIEIPKDDNLKVVFFEEITKPFTAKINSLEIVNFEQLSKIDPKILEEIDGIGPKTAEELIAKAKKIIEDK